MNFFLSQILYCSAPVCAPVKVTLLLFTLDVNDASSTGNGNEAVFNKTETVFPAPIWLLLNQVYHHRLYHRLQFPWTATPCAKSVFAKKLVLMRR
jgi:hypothetical protein